MERTQQIYTSREGRNSWPGTWDPIPATGRHSSHSGPQFPLVATGLIIASSLRGCPFGFNRAVVWDTDSVTNSGSWFPSWKGVEWEGWGCGVLNSQQRSPCGQGPSGGEKHVQPHGPGQKSQVSERFTRAFTFFEDFSKKYWFLEEEDAAVSWALLCPSPC